MYTPCVSAEEPVTGVARPAAAIFGGTKRRATGGERRGGMREAAGGGPRLRGRPAHVVQLGPARFRSRLF